MDWDFKTVLMSVVDADLNRDFILEADELGGVDLEGASEVEIDADADGMVSVGEFLAFKGITYAADTVELLRRSLVAREFMDKADDYDHDERQLFLISAGLYYNVANENDISNIISRYQLLQDVFDGYTEDTCYSLDVLRSVTDRPSMLVHAEDPNAIRTIYDVLHGYYGSSDYKGHRNFCLHRTPPIDFYHYIQSCDLDDGCNSNSIIALLGEVESQLREYGVLKDRSDKIIYGLVSHASETDDPLGEVSGFLAGVRAFDSAASREEGVISVAEVMNKDSVDDLYGLFGEETSGAIDSMIETGFSFDQIVNIFFFFKDPNLSQSIHVPKPTHS